MTAPNCAEVESRLIDALDGRLDAATSVRFHAHLETCAGCRDRAALWRALTPRLREAEPPPPDAMAIRRMQLEVERRLAGPALLERPGRVTAALAARARRARLIAITSTVGVALAAALLALWIRPPRWPGHDAVVAYAGLTGGRGPVTLAGRAVGGAEATRVAVGALLVLGGDGEADLTLDRGATVRVGGPARLTFEGTAADVAIRLDDGRVQVQVAHRRSDETFAVVTRDLRVEVRGTRFAVTATPHGSRVEVTEGRVAVRFPDGRSLLVPAGETFDSASPPREDRGAPDDAAVVAPVAPAVEAAPPASAPSCLAPVHACRITAQATRDSMRQGDVPRALRLVVEGEREAREVAPRCGAAIGACRDELGYLRAEALNQAGRAGDAGTAFHALDRRGAPAAMRQNALYAAAQIERQRGQSAAARADYERALDAAPRGALGEEALAGAMESAHAAAQEHRARSLAARYLRSFPGGLAAETARRLVGGGSGP